MTREILGFVLKSELILDSRWSRPKFAVFYMHERMVEKKKKKVVFKVTSEIEATNNLTAL